MALVLGAVVALQVVGHGDVEEHHDAGHALEAELHEEDGEATSAEGADLGPFRTVSLEVRGMT